MKVRFKEGMGGKDISYIAGEVYELKKETAERYIEHGICEKVIEVKSKRKAKK